MVGLASERHVDFLLALCEVDEDWEEVDDYEAADSSHVREYSADIWVEEGEQEADKDDRPSDAELSPSLRLLLSENELEEGLLEEEVH